MTGLEKTFGIIAIIMMVVCIIMGTVSSYQHNQLKIAELKLQDTAHYFSIEIDKAGNKYYEQQQIIATQKQAIEAGLIEKQELKNKNIKQLQSIIKLTESIKILSLKANYESPEIIYKYDTIKMDSQAFLRVPTQFNYRDEWIYISGSVRSTGVFHDSIKMNNSGTLMLGYKKSGFLKKSPVVTYESSNPYFEIKSMSNVVIEKDNKFWNYAMPIGSFLIGFYLGNKLK